MMLDIDPSKGINDAPATWPGIWCYSRWRAHARSLTCAPDTVARYGGRSSPWCCPRASFATFARAVWPSVCTPRHRVSTRHASRLSSSERDGERWVAPLRCTDLAAPNAAMGRRADQQALPATGRATASSLRNHPTAPSVPKKKCCSPPSSRPRLGRTASLDPPGSVNPKATGWRRTRSPNPCWARQTTGWRPRRTSSPSPVAGRRG